MEAIRLQKKKNKHSQIFVQWLFRNGSHQITKKKQPKPKPQTDSSYYFHFPAEFLL